jgi:hypothetical protein
MAVKHSKVKSDRLIKKNREFAIKHDLPTLVETFDLNKELWPLSKFKQLSERFNPDWFRPAALDQARHGGKYTTAPYGSKAFKDYWDTQIERIRNGYNIHGYHCPGDLYNFLNFYVLPVIQKNPITGNNDRTMGHPEFWDVHYYFAHYIEWCRKTNKDGVCLKPRGVGWSEYVANMGTRMYTGFPNSTTLYTASAEGYLIKDGILTKAWRQLEYMNQETQRGLKKLRMVYDMRMHKRASKKDKEGNESGWLSEILGLVVDSPEKLRGTRANLLVMEEGGSFKKSKKVVMTAKALTTIGGVKFGLLIVFGTGGDESSTGEALMGLMEMYYKPSVFDMLPIKNRYNEAREVRETGFFFGAYECMLLFMSSQGITDVEEAYNYHLVKRKEMEEQGAVKELQDYKAEYPFIPEDAFSKSGTNIFNKIKIANQQVRLRNAKDIITPERGELEWIRKPGTNKITGVKWIKTPNGRIRILQHPEKDRAGNPYKNLYIGGIDSIDFGTENSLIGDKGSKFSIVVKKKYLHAEKLNNIYVAEYTERPTDERIAYETALKLCIYYQLKVNVERTKKEVISYFRQHKMLRFIAKEPSIIKNDISSDSYSGNYGTPINEKIIIHYLKNIKNYINDSCDMMFFAEILDEWNNYAYELKTKFDRVAAMGMCELLDEDMDAAGLDAKAMNSEEEELKSFGFYIDEKGYKRYGEIPEKSYATKQILDKLELETQPSPLRWVDAEEEPSIGHQENSLQFEISYHH